MLDKDREDAYSRHCYLSIEADDVEASKELNLKAK